MKPSNRSASLPTGFAGSYDDYIDTPLNLHELLLPRPAATIFFRIAGHDLASHGVHEGDVAVVDRSLKPNPMDLVLAVTDGEFLAQQWLRSERVAESPTDRDDQPEQEIVGVITSIIRQLRQG